MTAKVIDLTTVRVARAGVDETGPLEDSGLRVVVISDPGVADEEVGWHCYGPFATDDAGLVADDMRTALDVAGMPEVQVRLVMWEPWPEEGPDELTGGSDG